MTETTTTTISDDMCRAAIEAGKPDRIQGFTYEINGQVTHVVRDLTKPVGDSAHKLWVGSSHPEMMERCAIERMRLQLAAALAAPSPAAAAPSARFATPDNAVAELWRHLPKTPAMWETVEPLSAPPLWLYEAMDKALTLLPAAPSAAQPVAWMCEDLILPDDKPLFTQVREHAERRAEAMHEGKPAWRVTPLYAAAPGAQPSQGGSVSEAATVAMVIPYTDEDDRPDMPEWRMISIGRPGDIPDHVLDRIPAKAAGIICEAINAASLSAARASAPAAPEVVEALQPFAAVAEHDIGDDEADADQYRPMASGNNRAPLITVGDLRRALRAIRAAGEAANG